MNPHSLPAAVAVALAAALVAQVKGQSATATIQFGSSRYSVAENGGAATITVVRDGDTNSVASIDYSTTNGTAQDGDYYTPASGTLHFGVGELSQTFQVPILDNGLVDGNKTVDLVLTNPLGASLGLQGTAVLTMVDNERPAPWLDSNFVADLGNNPASLIALQDDGKILVGGYLDSQNVNDSTVAATGTIIRLNHDGSRDPTFAARFHFFASNRFFGLRALEPLADGSVLVGGGFTKVENAAHSGLIRLQPDGTLDTNFTTGISIVGVFNGATGPDAEVTVLQSQPNGGVLVGGAFTRVNGVPRNGLARLLPSGALDTNFNARIDVEPNAIALLSNEQIYVVGGFGTANGARMGNIARFNADGTLNTNFHSKFTTGGSITSLAVQPDGKVIIGGSFSQNGSTFRPLARLNPDGTFDTDFVAGPIKDSSGSGVIYNLALQTDGKIWIEGSFSKVGNLLWTNLARLLPSGAPDPSFTIMASEYPQSMLLQADGDMLLAGFGDVNGVYLPLARVHTDSSRLHPIEFSTATYAVSEGAAQALITLHRAGESTATVSVNYAASDGTAVAGLDYLPQSGTLTFRPLEVEKTFTIPILPNGLVDPGKTVNLTLSHPSTNAQLGVLQAAVLVIQDDPDLLHFVPESLAVDENAGSAAVQLTRGGDLSAPLTLDYSTGNGTALAGKDYQAESGTVTFAAGQATQTIPIPVLDNGAVDRARTVQVTISSNAAVFPHPVTALLTIRDNEVPVLLDPSFRLPPVNGSIQAAILQPDGKLVVAGQFGSPGQVVRNGLVRFNTDGTVDSTFEPGAVLGNSINTPTVSSMAMDNSGRLLVAGNFTRVNGVNRLHLVRLNADGSVDTAFDAKVLVTGPSPKIVVQPDNKVIVAGRSAAFWLDGSQVYDVVRLNSDGTLDASFSAIMRPFSYTVVIALRPDGKLLLGDAVGQGNSGTSSLARFDAGGHPDPTFHFARVSGASTNQDVQAITLQPDGKILLLGSFESVSPDGNGTIFQNQPARYLADGSVDATFKPDPSLGSYGGPIDLLSDGRVLLGNGDILRADGSLSGQLNVSASLFVVQPDDRILAFDAIGLTRLFSSPNQPGGPEFTSNQATVAEDGGAVLLTVQRLGDVSQPLSVEYRTVEGTARAGQDYSEQNGTLRFNPLQATGTISIPILKNAAASGGPYFPVQLEHPSPGAFLQFYDNITVTIVFSDQGIQFTTDIFSANENDGVAELTVTRVGDGLKTALVDYATTDQSARAGQDYLARTGTIAFGPGELSQTIQIPILDNGVVDGDRSFGVKLFNARDGATLGPRTNATLVIFDNERPTVVDPSFDPGQGGIAYGGGVLNPFSMALQTDGKILVGGNFSRFNGFPDVGVARLNADGSVDTSFRSAIAGFAAFTRIAAQPDGKVLCIYAPPGGAGSGKTISRLNSDGTKDRGFHETLFLAMGGGDNVRVCVVQPDGKILVGGRFDMADAVGQTNLARLNVDGTLDPMFQVQVGPGDASNGDAAGVVWNILLQPDGKILIGGNFLWVNQTITEGYARLAPDGTVDPSFSVPDLTVPGTSASLDLLGVQPDGKILVQQNGIYRLGPDGALDPTFSRTNAYVATLVDPRRVTIQPDGKLLFFGSATENGVTHSGLIRLLSDGALDPLAPGLSIYDGNNRVITPVASALQPDGKVLVMGDFTSINDVPRHGIARLFGDGPPDIMFATAQSVAIEASGLAEVTVRRSGDTSLPATIDYATLDGTALADQEYTPTSGTLSFGPLESEKTFVVPILDDGTPSDDTTLSVVLSNPSAGTLATAGLTKSTLTILDSERPGSLDALFNPLIETPSSVRIALQPDGRVVVAGDFQRVNGVTRNGIARLLPDGSLDTTFDPKGGLVFKDDAGGLNPTSINSLILQPDGKILVRGYFNLVGGLIYTNLARLNSDGSVDTAFLPDPIAQPLDGYASALAVQADGKILLAESRGDLSRANLGRLNSNGALDPTFLTLQVNEVLGWSSTFGVMVVGSDGRPVFEGYVGSSSPNVSGDRQGMTRLNLDGSIDQTFSPMLDSWDLTAAIVQPEGKIIIAGSFSEVNGIARPQLARLNADGSTDTAFAPVSINNGYYGINAMALQADGKLLAALSDGSVVRFDLHGARDPSFQLGGGTFQQPGNTGSIGDLIVQSDGQILVAGGFSSVAGAPRTCLARLNGDVYLTENLPRIRSIVRTSAGGVSLRLNLLPGHAFAVQSSTNLIDWTSLPTQPANYFLFNFTDPQTPVSRRFYRVVQTDQ